MRLHTSPRYETMLTFIKHVIFNQMLQNLIILLKTFIICNVRQTSLYCSGFCLEPPLLIGVTYAILNIPGISPLFMLFLNNNARGLDIAFFVCVCVYVCVCVFYLGYLVKFTVTVLVLFVYDSGAIPRGHRLVHRISVWC